jgi:hypothetical protein
VLGIAGPSFSRTLPSALRSEIQSTAASSLRLVSLMRSVIQPVSIGETDVFYRNSNDVLINLSALSTSFDQWFLLSEAVVVIFSRAAFFQERHQPLTPPRNLID